MVEDLKKLLKYDGISRRKIKKVLGCSDHVARVYCYILQYKDELSAFFGEPEKFKAEMTETKEGLSISSPVSKNKAELLKRFELDPKYWECTKFVANEWGAWGNYNRQAKAWLTRIGDIKNWETFKKEFIDDVKKDSPVVPRINYKHNKVGKLLEVSIFDLHLGKLAWAMESGSNYDSKIAKQRFFDALHHLVQYAKHENIVKILFPVGNDFFNSDKDLPYPMTTKGTPQESDIRWQKVWRNGRQMIITAIEFLKKVAPVDIVVVSGNHDHQKMFYLGDLLDVKYENDENVTVNNSPAPRKYYEFGNCMIGFTHGKRSSSSENRLVHLMPVEQPQMWARTKFREWHCGHTHHRDTMMSRQEKDISGVTVRYMRTLKGRDAWETGEEYFSLGGAEALVWDKKHGKVANYFYNL